jgi:hypothetical protein
MHTTHNRLEYDAHKNELVRMQQASSGHYGPDIQRAEERVNECKQRYDRLRDDVQVCRPRTHAHVHKSR